MAVARPSIRTPAKSGFSTRHSRRGFWPGEIVRAEIELVHRHACSDDPAFPLGFHFIFPPTEGRARLVRRPSAAYAFELASRLDDLRDAMLADVEHLPNSDSANVLRTPLAGYVTRPVARRGPGVILKGFLGCAPW